MVTNFLTMYEYIDIIPILVNQLYYRPSYLLTPIENLYYKLNRASYKNNDFITVLDSALKNDIKITIKILFNNRDCRMGKGNKRNFIKAFAYIGVYYPEYLINNLINIPIYGCYKDIFEIINEMFSNYYFEDFKDTYLKIIDIISKQLVHDYNNMIKQDYDKISMLAKWIPSEGKHLNKKMNIYESICISVFKVCKINTYYFMKLRKKYITPLRDQLNILEKNMCNKTPELINNIPYNAQIKFKKYFNRENIKLGVENIKTNNYLNKIYYEDIINNLSLSEAVSYYMRDDSVKDELIEQQWKLLLNDKIIKKSSLSNSLVYNLTKNNEIAVILSILISSITKEPFKNTIINNNNFLYLENIKTLYDKVNYIKKNKSKKIEIVKVYENIFDYISNFIDNVNDDNCIAKRIYILTDHNIQELLDENQIEKINILYSKINYRPEIIFWNTCKNTQILLPIEFMDLKIIYINGYNKDILKYLLNNMQIKPEDIITEIISNDRYNKIV